MSQTSRRLAAADVAELDTTGRTLIVKTDKGRELRIRSHRVAQIVSGGLALLIALATASWLWAAWKWFDPCRDTGPTQICEQPSGWFRYSQAGLAVVGMITGALVIAYLLRFALRGRLWRRSRALSITHGSIILGWLVIWTIGALSR